MPEITKCLNEWNVIIEALGQGKQTILIRKYGTNFNEFLLYPTIGYTKKNNILNYFIDNEQNFVENNLYSTNKDLLSKVKYYATVEEIIKESSTEIDKYDKFHIWTKKHVKRYIFNRKDIRIWILRVYELDEPQMLKKTRGMLFANVNTPVKLEGKPVIPDDEFNKLKEEILDIHS